MTAGTLAAPIVQLIHGGALGGQPELRRTARRLRPPPGHERSHVSRSYRDPLALVAWHRDRVGVDIERVEVCGSGLAATICTPAERELVGTGDRELISLWCAKEALAKAFGAPLRYDPRRLEAPSGWSDGCCGPWRAAELDVAPGHVAWVCWRSAVQGTERDLAKPILGRAQVSGLDPAPRGQQKV
jgi:phosphopantetheinyl transferase